MRIQTHGVRALLGAAILALAACAGGPPPPTVVELTMAAAPNANPIPNADGSPGAPAPVVVRVYQLKSPAAFEDADFFQLSQDAGGALGDDLLGSDEYFITPNASQTVVSELNPDARFIGVAAAFYQIDTAQWRATLPIPPNETTAVTANIGETSVTLQ